jgi:DNA-binding CsgD family transcriptional regulator
LDEGDDGMMAIRGHGRQLLSVLVAPFRSTRIDHPGGIAVVFVTDATRPLSAAAALQVLFQLTPTEGRIAQALANGMTIEEIASANCATQQTVRKQLRGVFVKTGTNRQAECVAMILRSVEHHR